MRIEQNEKQTIGMLSLSNEGKAHFTCYTLELPGRANQRNISRIPPGEYTVVKHVSPKFGKCFHVLDVPGRSGILIHKGNYYRDTKGCILPGRDIGDMDGDGYKDVIASAETVDRLLELAPDKFQIAIIEKFG